MRVMCDACVMHVMHMYMIDILMCMCMLHVVQANAASDELKLSAEEESYEKVIRRTWYGHVCMCHVACGLCHVCHVLCCVSCGMWHVACGMWMCAGRVMLHEHSICMCQVWCHRCTHMCNFFPA